jgi:hypothetical protein
MTISPDEPSSLDVERRSCGPTGHHVGNPDAGLSLWYLMRRFVATQGVEDHGKLPGVDH